MTTKQPGEANWPRSFETRRPDLDPVVIALASENPCEAFIDLMRNKLEPAEWEYPIENGFAWTPYRLRHSIECLVPEDGPLVARSTFVLVENADEGMALNMVGYLNQRSFGGAVWYNSTDSTVCVTSVVHLQVEYWWNAYLFASIVLRLVGICEQLAPRLANWVGGNVALDVHPEHDTRTDPDQLVAEHTIDTFAPEAGSGLWWSEGEVRAFREALSALTAKISREVEWPRDTIPGTLLSDSMGATMAIDFDDGRLTLTVGEVDHPDLGLGIQILSSSSVQFAGNVLAEETQSRSWDALFIANELNRLLALSHPAALTLAGWTLWDNQLHHATYLPAEVVRMLQSAAQPTLGEALALLVRDVYDNADPLSYLLGHQDNADVEWAHADGVTWRGVCQNAGRKSLLVDELECVPRAIDGLPVNMLLSEPIELDDELWALQHSNLIMTMGIFNPMGPSIGSLELDIDYNLQRALLTERTRNPFGPSLRLWAVLDRDGFTSLSDFVEPLVERLQWSTFDWVRIAHPAADVEAAVLDGLRRFILRSGVDIRAEAQSLVDGMENPWVRLDHAYEPSGSLDEIDVDDADLWAKAVTHPRVVDSALAYLRSAWEGSKAFVQEPNDPNAAEIWVARIGDEVASRRAGPQST